MGITQTKVGNQGPTGPTGSAGVTGPIGATGATGATGFPNDTPGAWTALSLSNAQAGSWANYGSGYQTCQYRKIGDIVYIRGLAQGTIVTTGVNQVWDALPAGFRPPGNEIFSVINSVANANRFDVYSDGSCYFFGALNSWLSLTGLSWSTV